MLYIYMCVCVCLCEMLLISIYIIYKAFFICLGQADMLLFWTLQMKIAATWEHWNHYLDTSNKGFELLVFASCINSISGNDAMVGNSIHRDLLRKGPVGVAQWVERPPPVLGDRRSGRSQVRVLSPRVQKLVKSNQRLKNVYTCRFLAWHSALLG